MRKAVPLECTWGVGRRSRGLLLFDVFAFLLRGARLPEPYCIVA